MAYSVLVKTDPRIHVQDPVTVPWITVGTRTTKRAADALAAAIRADGCTVKVVSL